MSVDGKVIVLFGAGGMLGHALTAGFAADGAAALVLGDLTVDSIDVGALACEHREAVVDVRDQASVSALVDRAKEEFGRVDVVVNNAGVISPNGRLHNLTDADWQRAFDINVMGAVHGIRAAVDVMRPNGGGSIINTASVAGLTAWAYAGPYAVSKAAIIHLTKVAALEYAKERIRVNCVCPGVFPSSMHADFDDSVMQALADKHPLGLGTPAELVAAYLYLASDGSSWTTGSSLVVDGGYSVP
jgi:3-oxoacyl-[acyl-carrier protein] reductase